jgi:alkaline phosphatase D
MDARTTRRHFLYAGAAAGAMVWLPDGVLEADAASRPKVPLARGGGFASGVMSGDPAPDRVTLWTRLDDQEAARSRVRLEIARDEGFRNVVLRRDVPITALRDHTAKVRVGGLQPDRRYWFRFRTRTTTSPVGRTQTAPPADSRRPVKIGYFACQAYTAGFYGAYQALLREDPDFVICGGDYIYEDTFADDGYDRARPDRTGRDRDGLAVTIDDYRAKYRLYRSDPDLRELHRLVPLVPQWDDHEVADNYVPKLATGDELQPSDDGSPRLDFNRPRVLSGWRAWHEHMPAQRFGKGYRTHRRLRFGRQVDLFMLDCRTFRDDQVCGSASRCSGQGGKYLGDEQLAWVKDGLASSDARWKLVGNQLMVMPFNFAADVQVEGDSWNGYKAERGNLLAHIGDRGIKDVVFLTGDIHTFFAGRVLRGGTEGPAVASELVGGSTTSPGTSEFVSTTAGGAPPPDLVKLATDQARATNPWFDYAETRAHGVMLVTAAQEGLTAKLLASRVRTSREASADVRTLATLQVAPGVPGVQVA